MFIFVIPCSYSIIRQLIIPVLTIIIIILLMRRNYRNLPPTDVDEDVTMADVVVLVEVVEGVIVVVAVNKFKPI